MDNVSYVKDEKDLKRELTMEDKDMQTEYGSVDFVEVTLKEKDSGLEVEEEDSGAYSRQELLGFSNTVGWRVARWTILTIFALGWTAMVAIAIYILAITPACIPWWKSSIIYQIYPQSFSDSNGDGVGDIQGIIDHLDHFEYMNVKALWINSVYKSGGVDLANDVTDYEQIDSLFGDMKKFEELIQSVHEKGMKIIVDFIPNHSSIQHEWFSKSAEMPESEYNDYYIWADGNSTTYPNNWHSVYGGPAWTYNDIRGQFYLHQFWKEEPDLNFRNPALLDKIEKTMEFWLEKGVDGFRIDSAGFLLESVDLTGELSGLANTPECSVSDDEYELYNHNNTKEYDGLHDIIRNWRKRPLSYYSTTKSYRMMVTDNCASVDTNLAYYGTSSDREADFPFNYNLLNIESKSTGSDIQTLIKNEWLDKLNSDQHSNFLLGNDDHSRIATRMGREYARAANILLLSLPGTPFTYYGEEIGMVDGPLPASSQDPFGKDDATRSRDPYRSPMQWSSEENAGFTTGNSSWLPINEDYITTNVESQKENKTSMLNLYRKMALLREERTFLVGGIEFLTYSDPSLTYIRTLSGYKSYLVVINFGITDLNNIDLWIGNRNDIEALKLEGVILVSSNMDRNGEGISLDYISIAAYEALVIEM